MVDVLGVVPACANRSPPFNAAFEATVAVAASTIADVPWTGTSRGDAVDRTAPGASVWRAEAARDDSGRVSYRVARGSGRSFAVATVAGIAALWISYHGWTTLVQRYGADSIPRVFKSLMQSTCRTPQGWNAEDYGPGIVTMRGRVGSRGGRRRAAGKPSATRTRRPGANRHAHL